MKFGFDIKLDQWFKYFVRLEMLEETARNVSESMCKKMAYVYRNDVYKGIIEQRHRIVDLSDSYKEWKSRYYPKNATNIWMMNEDVLKFLKSEAATFPISDMGQPAWVSGITAKNASYVPAKKHTMSYKSKDYTLFQYALTAELGRKGAGRYTKYQPPRPVFLSVLTYDTLPKWEKSNSDGLKKIGVTFSRRLK